MPSETEADKDFFSSSGIEDQVQYDLSRFGGNEIVDIPESAFDSVENQIDPEDVENVPGNRFLKSVKRRNHTKSYAPLGNEKDNEEETFFQTYTGSASDSAHIPTKNIPIINIPILNPGGKSFVGKPSGLPKNPIPFSSRYSNYNPYASPNSVLDHKYPRDCYSLISANGPDKNGNWTKLKIFFFLVGLIPFVFQIAFLVLLMWSQVDEKRGTVGENDNPGQGFFAKFISAGTSRIVRWTQLVSLGAYVVFPDAGLKDVVTAVQCFPRSSKIQSGDRVGVMRLSCLLRLIQGASAMIATLLLILTSDTVVDIILNFTAVSFISNLDDYGFFLAISGELGPELQDEARRLAVTDLPPCMYRSTVPKYVYNRIVQIMVFIVLFGSAIVVIVAQNSSYFWTTKILRVQFQEETGLNGYSGCFEYNDRVSWFQRHAYNSIDAGNRDIRNASFGYCREKRAWILYKGHDDNFDPCDAKGQSVELARSAKTDAFDIQTSFDDSWVSTSNTPLDLYFFPGSEKDIKNNCSNILGDGSCDPYLNVLDYNYDGGDCCAATCDGSKCGINDLSSAFDQSQSTSTEISFPNCTDPEMVPVIITLNSVVSSRAPELSSSPIDFNRLKIDEGEWRAETPVAPYFALDCNRKNVLTVYIELTMEHNSEIVMVEDGAECSLVVRNSTSRIDLDPEIDDPIWIINYTISHDVEDENIEILTQSSGEKEEVKFRRLPSCYFRKLGDYIDVINIYARSDLSRKTIDWLVRDNSYNSQCEDEEFIERFALVKMYHVMGTTKLISTDRQCQWESITCNKGKVNAIKLQSANLERDIPSEIGLLRSLEELELSHNSLSSISKEIRKLPNLLRLYMSNNLLLSFRTDFSNMTRLQVLDLHSNSVSSIPTSVGKMSSLTKLVLSNNSITSMPTEIGLMTNLEELILDSNEIESLPTEIGYMSGIKLFSFVRNRIFSIPTEVGLMTSLEDLDFGLNFITSVPDQIGRLTSLEKLYLSNNYISSLPSEFGQMTELQTIRLANNTISSLPSEFGLMTELQILHLQNNRISSIPTEIGLIKNLEEVVFYNNLIAELPKEIGMMTKIQTFVSGKNKISSLPTEIGRMANLQQLDVYGNYISSLPTEAGKLTRLDTLYLHGNNIQSLPTEIGLMTSLQVLSLYNNNNSVIPTEVGLLTQLEKLFFNDNKIQSLPTEIGMMTSLQSLQLHNNNILVVPTEIGLLTQLENLSFDDNKIQSLPTEIGMMTSLQSPLLYNNNNISVVPTEIGLLTQLEHLLFNDNKIQSLPTEIGLLTGLQSLQLHDNKIQSLPTEIGLLTGLQSLQLHDNKIQSLPTEFGMLRNLQSVFLDHNKISALPSELGSLSKLQTLFLYDSEIPTIPSEIGLMSSLQIFDLRLNNITSVPTEIGRMSGLQQLGLSHNLIKEFPSEIGLLTGLKALFFNDNLITSIPTEIGLLTSLKQLTLEYNIIMLIPSEIGLLTNLTNLKLNGNNVTYDMIPEELDEMCLNERLECNLGCLGFPTEGLSVECIHGDRDL